MCTIVGVPESLYSRSSLLSLIDHLIFSISSSTNKKKNTTRVDFISSQFFSAGFFPSCRARILTKTSFNALLILLLLHLFKPVKLKVLYKI